MARCFTALDNWDIVDSVRPKIVGEHLLGGPHGDLYAIAGSGEPWAERIAIVATLAFIRKDHSETTLVLAEGFLDHGQSHEARPGPPVPGFPS